ncbi:hypothetical protein SRABI106_04620 [Rahnella aquatilis]|nr:hypothetical protein SRABI106_04620 [Rahnella aquatilis]
MRHQVIVDQILLERLHKGFATGIQPDAVVGTGVIHQPVDTAVAGMHLIHRRLATGFVAQFSQYKTGLWRKLLQFMHQFIGRFGIADDHRNRAFFRQRQRNRRADTGTAAGDHHHFILQMQIHQSFPVIGKGCNR